MQLPNPKELKALLKVCREYGVDEVEVGELKLKFGDMPGEQSAQAEESITGAVMPSDEDMAYWSAQPDPMLAMVGNQ